LEVHGVGQKKAADFGTQFVACITTYCREHGVAMDIQPPQTPASNQAESAVSVNAIQAFPLFDERLAIDQVAERLSRAVSTTYQYLEAYIRHRKLADAHPWIPRTELEEVFTVAQHAGTERLKPIYEALHGRIPYERIRIAVACLANVSPDATTDDSK
jgi:hypothetical protein